MAKAKKETKQEALEVVLWKAADKLRKNIDAAEYKHVVLGVNAHVKLHQEIRVWALKSAPP